MRPSHSFQCSVFTFNSNGDMKTNLAAWAIDLRLTINILVDRLLESMIGFPAIDE